MLAALLVGCGGIPAASDADEPLARALAGRWTGEPDPARAGWWSGTRWDVVFGADGDLSCVVRTEGGDEGPTDRLLGTYRVSGRTVTVSAPEGFVRMRHEGLVREVPAERDSPARALGERPGATIVGVLAVDLDGDRLVLSREDGLVLRLKRRLGT